MGIQRPIIRYPQINLLSATLHQQQSLAGANIVVLIRHILLLKSQKLSKISKILLLKGNGTLNGVNNKFCSNEAYFIENVLSKSLFPSLGKKKKDMGSGRNKEFENYGILVWKKACTVHLILLRLSRETDRNKYDHVPIAKF